MDKSKENRKIETKELVRQYLKRKYPDGDYCDSNCEFACVICNNAKSDMISAEEFKEFFVPGIEEYWKHIKVKILRTLASPKIAWMKKYKPEEQKIARHHLLKYCELDTYAMVKVWEELVRAAE